MALNYNATLKSARLNAVTTEVGNAGKLSLYAANGTTILATFTMGSPFAGASSAGAALAPTAPASTTALADGTMTTAKIFKTDGTTVVVSGLTVSTVAAGTGDVQFTGTCAVNTGATVALSSLSIAHAA